MQYVELYENMHDIALEHVFLHKFNNIQVYDGYN